MKNHTYKKDENHILDAQKQNNNELAKNLYEVKTRLINNDLYISLDRYIGLIYENPCTILDYFKKDTVVFICEYKKQKQVSQNLFSQIAEDVTDLIKANIVHKSQKKISFDFFDIINKISEKNIILLQTFRSALNDFKLDKFLIYLRSK
jgi:aromatic ring-opening dioxygenase LigB subunit